MFNFELNDYPFLFEEDQEEEGVYENEEQEEINYWGYKALYPGKI